MLRLAAAAKVNLTLEVLARRDDGYHAVRTLMVPIGLYDDLTLEPGEPATFACNDARVGASNSVERALAAVQSGPMRVVLDKRIPLGAGLGGGSSDAAAVLLAAMSGAFGTPAVDAAHDWLGIARSLGSDVPFFLTGTGALVEGTGERVTAAGSLPPWWIVVAQPPVAMSTADAYRLLDEERARSARATRPRATSVSLLALEALQRADFDGVVATLSNDFEPVLSREFPAVARATIALAEAARTRAQLTGSGACSFALFATERAAREAAERLDRTLAAPFVAPLVADARWR